jgi:hypothetical protein
MSYKAPPFALFNVNTKQAIAVHKFSAKCRHYAGRFVWSNDPAELIA